MRPGIEWPILSGLIVQDIGNYAELISIVSNADINNLHKNFGLFEFEATGLQDHLIKYQRVMDQLEITDIKKLLKSGADNDVFKRRLEKCQEIINNLAQNFAKLKEKSQREEVEEVLKRATGGLTAVGKSKENKDTDPFENFMGEIRKNLINILMPNSLEEKDDPLGLYKNYKAQVSKDIAKKLKSRGYALPLENASDNRVYNPKNIFGNIIQDPQQNLKTSLYENSKDVMAFDDLRKRTAEHFLVIPKGPYISLPHFAAHANDNEMVDILRTIADVAQTKGLDKTGYRVVSNHAITPGSSSDNNANQEVPHFHFHVAGGECLGRPVALASGSNSISYGEDMPFGLGLSPKDLVRIGYQNEIATEKVDYKGQTVTLLAYAVPEKLFGVPVIIGILVLDEKQNPIFSSFHEFAKKAEGPLIKALFTFTTKLAKSFGLYYTGYRVLSNTGPDAWEFPNVFQLFIAGGKPLGPTVTNVYGNLKGAMDKNIYDFVDLRGYNHEHCPNLSEFSKTYADPAELGDLQRKNRILYTDNLSNLQWVQTQMKSISSYLRGLQSQASTPLMQKIADQKELRYQEVIKTLPGVEVVMNELAKYDLDRKEYPSLKENQRIFKVGHEIRDKLISMRNMVTGIKFSVQQGYNIRNVDELSRSVLKKYDLNTNSWLFLDLDDVITKGIDSLVLTEKDIPDLIKDLQAKGKVIMALTNRYYWDGMDSEPANKSHRDTFNLMKQLGITFSNPGNLKPFLLNTKNGVDEKHQSKFKDGVIFCADDPQGKGECLKTYLSKLAEANVPEFPDEIEFADDRLDNVHSVVNVMEDVSLAAQGYWYKP